MKRRSGRDRLVLTVIVIFLASIALSSLYLREEQTGPLHTAEKVIRDLLSVPLTTAYRSYDAARDWLTSVARAGQLKKENELLRRELVEARRLVLEAEDVRQENEKLRSLLELRSRFAYRTIPAEIIFVHEELSGKFFTIDRGREDGVEEDMPVVVPSGLFGKIYSAGKDTSIVLPLNHPLSAAAVRIVETGQQGILEGSRSGRLYLRLIPRESTVTIGMTVVTSGRGGVYPKGILVGTIKKVTEDPNRLDLLIEVGTPVAFSQEDFVLVLAGEEK